MTYRLIGSLAAAVVLTSCGSVDGHLETAAELGLDTPPPVSRILEVETEVITSGFDIPWGLEVIAENEFLFTERHGDVLYHRDGQTIALAGLPSPYHVVVDGMTWGGMMDVSLHPSFESSGLVYLAFVNRAGHMVVARFNLIGDSVEGLEVVFESDSFSIGSRIAWQDEDHFFVTQGVGGTPFPEPGPQDLSSDAGKIHRLLADGSVPTDNPVFPGQSRPSSIWSYGHRDPQGLYIDADDGRVYSHEHGPLGGDELNVLERGANFGWPIFSYGLNYDGSVVSSIPLEEAEATTVLPIKHWDSRINIAPSGLERLQGSLFPEWDGAFLIGSLAQERLIAYDPATDETAIILEDVGRVRDVAQSPAGAILLLIDAHSPGRSDEGRLVRLTPR